MLRNAHRNSPSNIPKTPGAQRRAGTGAMSSAEQLVTKSGDLSVAQDDENYLNNRGAIDALLAANVSMAGSRHGCRHALFA